MLRIPNPEFQEGDEGIFPEYLDITSKFEVCPSCYGKGKSSGYLGAFTQSDFEEQGPEFLEDYLNGEYDRTCPECKGQRVVEVIDESRNSPELIEAYNKHLQEEYAYEQLVRMENRENPYGP